MNPASNRNALFDVFCSAVENLELRKEFDLTTTERLRNKLADNLLENKAQTTGTLTWAKLAVN